MLKYFISQAVHVPCQSLTSHLRLDYDFYPSTRFKLVCRHQFGMTLLLKYLIMEYNEFKELYPDRNLIPKYTLFALAILYPQKIGPLIHMWRMRLEVKHRIFKKFKNITKCLAKKHPMFIACHWEISHLKCSEYAQMKSIYVDNDDYWVSGSNNPHVRFE